MPANRKKRIYYMGPGNNILLTATDIYKKEAEKNKRKREKGVKIAEWIEALSAGCPPEIAKALIRRKYGTATDREEEIVLREIEEMKKSIEKEKKEKEKKDSKNEGR